MYQPGDKIEGRYHIFDCKQGGMGQVFLCEDREWIKDGQPLKVAVKTLLPELQRRKGAADRFYNEARLWVELGKHPNILQALYVKRIKGLPFIFMEYITPYAGLGPDLDSWISSGALNLERSLRLALQFCKGMIHATQIFSEKGLRFVHRDIKPGNTMINQKGQVKITDFGLAKIADEEFEDQNLPSARADFTGNVDLTMAGTLMGTPKYMSPEQCRGSIDLDLRSDIYAFGCMFFEMLTGQPPFVGQTMNEICKQHLNTPPPAPSARVPELPARLDPILLKCLQKNRDDRYRDFSAVQDELGEVLIEVTGLDFTSTGPKKEPDRKSPAVGDQLNKSFSLFELGRRQEGVQAFAEAIGRNNAPIAKTQGTSESKDKARRLVKGGLVAPAATSPSDDETAVGIRKRRFPDGFEEAKATLRDSPTEMFNNQDQTLAPELLAAKTVLGQTNRETTVGAAADKTIAPAASTGDKTIWRGKTPPDRKP